MRVENTSFGLAVPTAGSADASSEKASLIFVFKILCQIEFNTPIWS